MRTMYLFAEQGKMQLGEGRGLVRQALQPMKDAAAQKVIWRKARVAMS